jgi:type VI secretion system protein ImpE
MNAAELFRQDELVAAVAKLRDEVRADPSNVGLRVFLFQLCCVVGDWARARTQLDVAAGMDDGALLMGRTYGDALICEGQRRKVLAGEVLPTILGDPQPWMAELYQALRLDQRADHVAAAALRARAFAAAPATAGRIDGRDFAWIADADNRFGPMLELIVNDRYLWLPFMRVARILIERPSDLRDQVWIPAKLQLVNGSEMVGLIPTRYPGSEHSADPLVRLARKTEWLAVAPAMFEGSGQRMLTTDVDEYPLMDIRSIELEHVLTTAVGAANG